MQANYIRLNVEPGRGVYEYEVKFSPDIDSRPLRSKLLAQHSAAICQGGARVFDGTTLFLPQALAKPVSILYLGVDSFVNPLSTKQR